MDDFPADSTTTGRVQVGGTSLGMIETAEDRDWFALTITNPQPIQISARILLENVNFEPIGFTDNPLTNRIFLYGPDGVDSAPLAETYLNTSGFGSLTYNVEQPGTYFVEFEDIRSNLAPFPYDITVDIAPDDFSNDPTTTGRAFVGFDGNTGFSEGKIDFRGDEDWFAVGLTAGTLYQIDLQGLDTQFGTLPDPLLSGLYDESGSLVIGESGPLGFDDDSGVGRNSRAFVSVPTDGTYFISAEAFNNFDVGIYSLRLSEIMDDFADRPDGAGRLEIGGSATGRIDFSEAYDPISLGLNQGDRDWFAVDLEAGGVYSFEALSDETNVYVQTLRGGPDGDVVLDSGFGDVLYYTPLTDETIFVEVGSYSYHTLVNLGDYTVEATGLFSPIEGPIASVTQAPATQISDWTYGFGAEDWKGTIGRDSMIGRDSGEVIRGLGEADILIGAGGNDVLIGDDSVPADIDLEMTAAIYRAYVALLGRTPDLPGLTTNVAAAERDGLYNTISNILQSEEFLAQSDALTPSSEYSSDPAVNAAFIDTLYRNLRGPDGAGDDPARDRMIDDLTNNFYYFADLAFRFSDSEELRNKLDGEEFSPFLRSGSDTVTDEIFTAYHMLLDRAPDLGGFVNWSQAMAGGLDLSGLADRIMQSIEYMASDPLSDRDFTEKVLTGQSGTAPTEAELDMAEALLAGGVSRGDYVAAMVTLSDDAGLVEWVRSLGYDDVLIGGEGNNYLAGGLLSDVFVFNTGDGGRQTVVDFEPWDRLDLRDFDYDSAADALAQFSQVENAAVFADQGVTVILRQTDLADITDASLLV